MDVRGGSRRFGHLVALFAVAILLCGCSGRPRVEKPDLDPRESGAKAVSLYDADGDSLISKEEAEGAPGVLAAFAKIDADQDEYLSAEEIEQRVKYYLGATTWVIPGYVTVLYKGKPLPNAEIVLEPESFLGSSFKACRGVTGPSGTASLSRPGAELKGIYLGFYRIRVTKEKKKGGEMLPAKYNTETILGFRSK